MTDRRYYVRSPDGGMKAGYDDANAARAVALDYGDGAHLVDTHAQASHPIAQVVADVNARDGDGTGALELARKRHKRALIELLERAGAVE